MKKKLFLFAVVMMATVGTVSAQDSKTSKTTECRVETCDKKDDGACCKEGKQKECCKKQAESNKSEKCDKPCDNKKSVAKK